MFESFFGCTKTPFDRSLDTKQLFPSDAHQEMIERMVHVAEHRKFGLCTGEVGAGKSTAARAVADRLNPIRFTVLYISDSDLSPRNFYHETLNQLGITPRFYRGDARRQLQKALLELHESHKTPVVMIDEGHLLSRDMLEEMRFLMNFRMDSFSPLSLILLGQPELRITLQTQAYEAIAQRVTLRFHLSGMSETETKSYILHHLSVVGVENSIFTDKALELIYEFTGGIARRINNLCTGCMLHACSKSKNLIDDHTVRVVFENEF